MDGLPTRKPNRLRSYNYSQCGMYFITICTENRTCVFGDVYEGEDTQQIRLSEMGKIAEEAIKEIPLHYPGVTVVQECVMPNHVHLLLEVSSEENHTSISWIVNQFKGYVRKRIGRPVWQKGFHDHVVRNEDDFQTIWEYIKYNPAKWKTDGYYVADK